MKVILIASLFIISFKLFAAEEVKIENHQLVVDGIPQPQLYGAEVQYFRLRAGAERNIPRAKVIALWNKVLDHAVEAGMNTISFYIPWDFHEYQEGKFDFDGRVDEDGDGNADYPSRDVNTFIRLIQEKGINKIMVRPGPYINAEWGFLGFGAIPLWFHEKYPDSHMQNSEGLRTKLYDYHSPDLLRHTRLWFKQVYEKVLKPHLGRNGSILFLQLDNETNFMWQSIFNHDYGPRARERYQLFLRSKYHFIEELNDAHDRSWSSWQEVTPAIIPGLNTEEDREWYEFQDYSIYTYLKKLRVMWEELGVKEPAIMFTLAESYNGMKNGILPNFRYRNARGKTGMMTMNLYPKTYEIAEGSLMNLPFKADHDVKAMDEANNSYTGTSNEWLMGPEIQGGWWKGVPVSEKSRKQTYLSTLGHGLKALYIYYFTEGQNWQADWAKKQIEPLYQALKASPEFSRHTDSSLPDQFWRKLQKEVNEKILVGFDVWRIMHDPEFSSDTLFFDAPIDHQGNPRAHFELLKQFGNDVIRPHQDFLGKAVRITDPIYLIKDDNDHLPSPVKGIDSVLLNAEWSGGILGYLAQAGFNPKIHLWKLSDQDELKKARYIVLQDAGRIDLEKSRFLKKYISNGGKVISLLGDSLARGLGINFSVRLKSESAPIKVHSVKGQEFDAAPSPIHHYSNLSSNCQPLLWQQNEMAGFKCSIGEGEFIQLGVLFYDIYNSDWYGKISDVRQRNSFLKSIVTLGPKLKIKSAGELTAFGRKTDDESKLWIIVKNGKRETNAGKLEISESLLKTFGKNRKIRIHSLMKNELKIINQPASGPLTLDITLMGHDSEVMVLEAQK